MAFAIIIVIVIVLVVGSVVVCVVVGSLHHYCHQIIIIRLDKIIFFGQLFRDYLDPISSIVIVIVNVIVIVLIIVIVIVYDIVVQRLPGSHSLHRDCDHHLDQHLATPQAIYHQKLIIESKTI